jgi:transposase-like protein
MKQANMAIREELIDELLKGCGDPSELLRSGGFLKQLSARLIERVLEAELSSHLGYERHAQEGRGSGNSRNGATFKRVKTELGEVDVAIPRDRNGTLEPKLVKKHQRRLEGFDEKEIALYAGGMTVRDIQAHLWELYGTDVSPDLISRVTDAVVAEMAVWQSRPVDAVWPVLYLDALVVKVRDQGVVRNKHINKHIFVAMGINVEGAKEVLGIWMETNEGAKLWLKVLTELKNRGLQDALVVGCDEL